MTRFNIIGKGFIELEDNGGIALKTENQQFRFAEISLGRSVQFVIPATDANRSLLGFADDPAETGEACRHIFDAQMIYDGGVRNGALAVTAYTGDAFACVFYMDGASWIESLQKKRLADCVCTLPSVVWGLSTPVVDADQADPFTGVQIVRYENGASHQLRQLTPSVNVWAYLRDILTNMGVLFNLPVSLQSLWMTSASMKGGGDDNVTLETTSQTTGTVTETVADYYFSAVPITVQSYKTGFGQIFNPTFTNVVGFRARRYLTIDVPQSYDDDVKMILWNNVSAGRYVELEYGEVRGKTITLHKDDTIFFSRKSYGQTNAEPYIGWKTIEAPFSVTLVVKRAEDLQDGETWSVQNNAPDMTVFELLKSVAVATGLELSVDAVTGIAFHSNEYGRLQDFKALERVVSIDDVRRNVAAWGNDTASVVVKFDSEEYVEERITAAYDVDNSQSKGTKDIVAKFSEGGVGDHGVLIQDVDSTGAKFEAKKWTLSRVDSGAANPTYLQRVLTPNVEGCDDVAMMSTCVKAKVAASQAAFMSLQPSTTFTWRGMAYVWTDADWSDGVMSLTLQKVAQPSVVIPDEPMVRVEWMESDGRQYIDLGIVPDDNTGIKVWMQYDGDGQAAGIYEGSNGFSVGVNYVGAFGFWGSGLNHVAFTQGVVSLNYKNDRTFKVSPDGGLESTQTLGTLPFSPTLPIYIFGINYDGTGMGFNNRISRVQITQGNDVIRDLMAVRVGSVGYLYDQIGGTLYANSGTGDFILGPDV